MKFLLSLMMLWGLLVCVVPWLINTRSTDETTTDMITTGLGIAIIASALVIWRQTLSDRR